MKNNYLLLFALSLSTFLTFAQTHEGVVINGVKWATCNVDSVGKFAANEYAAGMMYQWNTKVGWAAVGNIGTITATDGSTTWNTQWNGGEQSTLPYKWETANDPSPAGWRVPNKSEIDKLLDKSKVSYQEVYNNDYTYWYHEFTDIATGKKLILSHHGYRDNGWGGIVEYPGIARYWTTLAGDMYAYCLYAGNGFASFETHSHADGLLIRPVENTSTKIQDELFSSKITLYPTMVKDFFNIEGMQGSFTLQISSISGKILSTQNVNDNHKIDVTHLKEGIYIATITSKEGTAHKKFIKR